MCRYSKGTNRRPGLTELDSLPVTIEESVEATVKLEPGTHRDTVVRIASDSVMMFCKTHPMSIIYLRFPLLPSFSE